MSAQRIYAGLSSSILLLLRELIKVQRPTKARRFSATIGGENLTFRTLDTIHHDSSPMKYFYYTSERWQIQAAFIEIRHNSLTLAHLAGTGWSSRARYKGKTDLCPVLRLSDRDVFHFISKKILPSG